jgi:hypothetical protein
MFWNELAGDPLRETVRDAIMESSGEPLAVSDPLPDQLIFACSASGIRLGALEEWIYCTSKGGPWSASGFVRWAKEIEALARRNAEAR